MGVNSLLGVKSSVFYLLRLFLPVSILFRVGCWLDCEVGEEDLECGLCFVE